MLKIVVCFVSNIKLIIIRFSLVPTSTILSGDSAGGNLAAALSIKFRDSGQDVQFKYQVLLYPFLQGMYVTFT